MRPSALAVLLVRAGLSQAAAARFCGINQGTVSSACASAGVRKVGLLARENPVGCQVRLSTGMDCGAIPVEHFGGRDYCATHRAPLEAAAARCDMTLALQLAPGQHVIDEVTGRVVLALSVVLPLDTPSGRGLLYVREDDGHEHAIGLEVARAVEL